MQCLRRPDKGFGSLGTGILSGLVLPCGFWESNLSSLEEQPVFLTAEPSVQPLDFIFNIFVNVQRSDAYRSQFSFYSVDSGDQTQVVVLFSIKLSYWLCCFLRQGLMYPNWPQTLYLKVTLNL